MSYYEPQEDIGSQTLANITYIEPQGSTRNQKEP